MVGALSSPGDRGSRGEHRGVAWGDLSEKETYIATFRVYGLYESGTFLADEEEFLRRYRAAMGCRVQPSSVGLYSSSHGGGPLWCLTEGPGTSRIHWRSQGLH